MNTDMRAGLPRYMSHTSGATAAARFWNASLVRTGSIPSAQARHTHIRIETASRAAQRSGATAFREMISHPERHNDRMRHHAHDSQQRMQSHFRVENVVRERGSALKRGRHSTMFFPPNTSVHWQPYDLTSHTKKVVPRSRIPRSTSHLSYIVGSLQRCACRGAHCAYGCVQLAPRLEPTTAMNCCVFAQCGLCCRPLACAPLRQPAGIAVAARAGSCWSRHGQFPKARSNRCLLTSNDKYRNN